MSIRIGNDNLEDLVKKGLPIREAFQQHFPDSTTLSDEFIVDHVLLYLRVYSIGELRLYMKEACMRTGDPAGAKRYFCKACDGMVKDRGILLKPKYDVDRARHQYEVRREMLRRSTDDL